MRRIPIFALLVLCLYGCGDLPHAESAAAPAPVPKVGVPTLARSTKLGLFAQPGMESDELFVDDTVDQVESFAKAPKSATPFRTLPPGFEAPYTADGFEYDGVAFGVIYFSARVALAMKTYKDQTEEQVNQLEAAYEQSFLKPHPANVLGAGSKARYWFWDDSDKSQRFMICAVASKSDATKFDVTTAVGDSVVMDALRMKLELAKRDRMSVGAAPGPNTVHLTHFPGGPL